MINVEHLSKTFRLRKHHKGAWAGVRNLVTQDYRSVHAVDDISFQLKAGELVGYLGPNGAGKSTTLKMLTGLLVPTSGELHVNGLVPWQDRKRYVARIGAVFGQRTTLWWDLPVAESLELLQHIYRIPPARFKENLQTFSELLELGPFMGSPVRTLSLGQRMRADLCAALLHDPDLLFLDEPTIGLDVVAKERIRQFILHLNRERGTTIILTTHDLADVQKLCERVLIIDRGKLLFDGAMLTLQERFGGERRLSVDFSEAYADVAVEGARLLSYTNSRATYSFERSTSASDLIGRLSARFQIRDLSVEEPDVEATVRDIYEKRLLERSFD